MAKTVIEEVGRLLFAWESMLTCHDRSAIRPFLLTTRALFRASSSSTCLRRISNSARVQGL